MVGAYIPFQQPAPQEFAFQTIPWPPPHPAASSSTVHVLLREKTRRVRWRKVVNSSSVLTSPAASSGGSGSCYISCPTATPLQARVTASSRSGSSTVFAAFPCTLSHQSRATMTPCAIAVGPCCCATNTPALPPPAAPTASCGAHSWITSLLAALKLCNSLKETHYSDKQQQQGITSWEAAFTPGSPNTVMSPIEHLTAISWHRPQGASPEHRLHSSSRCKRWRVVTPLVPHLSGQQGTALQQQEAGRHAAHRAAAAIQPDSNTTTCQRAFPPHPKIKCLITSR